MNYEPVNKDALLNKKPTRFFVRNQSTPSLLTMQAKNKLQAMKGVEGVGEGANESITVYLSDPAVQTQIPETIEGYRVVCHVIGPISSL